MRCAGGVLGAFLLVVGTGCGSRSPELAAVHPARRDIRQVLVTNGRIEVASRVTVHSPVAGRVERLLVSRGDRVERGQDLLRLADGGQRDAKSQALAALEAARARLAQVRAGPDESRVSALRGERSKLVAMRESIRQEVRRLKRLVSRDAVPRAELEAMENQLKSVLVEIDAADEQISATPRKASVDEARAAVKEAKARLSAADRQVDRLAILAPRAGQVYSLAVAEGDFLPAGALAASIGEVDSVHARIYVDEPDLGRVRKARSVQITADAYPGREWSCATIDLATEVVEMGPRRVGEVLCDVANSDGALLPNLSVGVTIVTAQAERALSVPRSALRDLGDGAYVWTAVGGRAERRRVTVGVRGADYVEIRHGLDPGDVVLVADSELLIEGQLVRVALEGQGAE